MTVPSRSSKKQTVLDYFRAKQGKPLEARDLHAALNELRRANPDHRTSLRYMASTLREAGYDVRYEDRYADPAMPEPYASRLKGMLEFRDLAAAELSLQRLDALHRDYQSACDRAGMQWVRTLVKKGKRRARTLAANPRVRESKRREKLEIASWFQVWLETPDLFASWLELRKSSEEYRRLFMPAGADT